MSLLRRFHLPFGPSLLVVALLLLTVNLGFWQLRREAEKRELEQAAAAAEVSPAVPISVALAADKPQWHRIHASGEWLPAPLFVLENRSWQGRSGVHLLQWLRTSEGLAILVDRGWSKTPVLALAGTATVSGSLYLPGQPWRAPVVDLTAAEVRLPVLDLEQLRAGDANRLPYLLRLDASVAGALQANWQNTAGMTPAKHRGYAVTWFSLSIALVLLFFWWLYKTRPSQHD